MKCSFVCLIALAGSLLAGCEGPPIEDIDAKVFPPEIGPTTCFIVDEQKHPLSPEDAIFRTALEEALVAQGWRVISRQSEARVLIGYTDETLLRHYSAGSGYDGSLVPSPMNCADADISTAGATAGNSLSYTSVKTMIHAEDRTVSPNRKLWTLTATLPETYGRPDDVIPRFMTVASTHFGKETGGVIRIDLDDETSGR